MTRLLDGSITNKPSRMGRLRMTIWTRAVSWLCAVALMLLAFGHRPVETDPRWSDPQIASYLALGGSLADLCTAADEGQDHAARADCPVCTLAKSMVLAPALPAPVSLLAWSRQRAAWPETLVHAGQRPHTKPSRAPPFLRLI
jgi:hypothetical protein